MLMAHETRITEYESGTAHQLSKNRLSSTKHDCLARTSHLGSTGFSSCSSRGAWVFKLCICKIQCYDALRMSGECLANVWRMSGECLANAWRKSGESLANVWQMSGNLALSR